MAATKNYRTELGPYIKVDHWPPADREGWDIANLPQDPLDPDIGYAARWRPVTTKSIQEGYGRWLGWLSIRGQLDPMSDPGARITRVLVSAYLSDLRAAKLADYSIAHRIQHLADALRAIRPRGDWTWVQKGSTRLYGMAKPKMDPRTRIRPTNEVLQLGLDLMEEAEGGDFRTDYDRAVLFRDGLVICLQVYRALRIKNLSSVVMGQHLVREGSGWILRFTAAEMKAKRPFSCCWPTDLELALLRYVDHYRPVLLGDGFAGRRAEQELWVSKGGAPMTATVLAYRITHRTEARFGKPISSHAFRHMAATLIATDNPEGVTGIAGLLAHADLRTSEKHYNLARGNEAAARYQATLESIRRPMKRRQPLHRQQEELPL